MIFYPTPGIAILEQIERKTDLNTGSVPPSKNLLGKVVAIGQPGITKFGARVPVPQDADGFEMTFGDTVAFLTYQETGEYDVFELEGKKYYIVEFLDIRSILREN